MGVPFGSFFFSFLQDVLNEDVHHVEALLRLRMSKLLLRSSLNVVPKDLLTCFIASFFHRFFYVSSSFFIQLFCRSLGDSWSQVLSIAHKSL